MNNLIFFSFLFALFFCVYFFAGLLMNRLFSIWFEVNWVTAVLEMLKLFCKYLRLLGIVKFLGV